MRIGGLETILAVGDKYKNDKVIIGNIVGLLLNLADYAENGDRLKETVTDECVSLVMDAMKLFPNDPYTQSNGCGYFSNILVVNGMKKKLLHKDILTLLAKAFHSLRRKDPVESESAKKILVMHST